MKKKIVLLFISLMVLTVGFAQSDTGMLLSNPVSDSIAAIDSISSDSIDTMESVSTSTPIAPPEYKEGLFKQVQTNKTGVFYFILVVLLLFGIFRIMEPMYFKHLFESFLSTQKSVRHIKAKLGPHNLVHFMMTIVFYLVSGTYIYYALDLFADIPWMQRWPASVIILAFSVGVMLMYLIKSGFLMMLGSLFDIKESTNEYRYNISLINKILTLIMLPTILVMVFGGYKEARFFTLISFVIIGLALFNRYARSWDTVRYLVKNNRFHFFIYLCASEILPFVVLAKVILSR